jgi:hypothetical protein
MVKERELIRGTHFLSRAEGRSGQNSKRKLVRNGYILSVEYRIMDRYGQQRN